ncbi:hypothetical protein TNCT_676751 [Trichonephila clavata]|uniref:Uncharacterized protein n=1 Tax=Trichonephila clavata TaxID=2740835 RepID=A0A8X6JC82_TRICU|nr:hypothetical protein TNCT_676751 [Trichonephila clavata]
MFGACCSRNGNISIRIRSIDNQSPEIYQTLGLTTIPIRNILHGVLNQYPFILQYCHELLTSDTVEKEAFVRGGLTPKVNKIPLVHSCIYTPSKKIF